MRFSGPTRNLEVAFLLALLAPAVSAAGFDCARAARPVEKLICGDAELSRQDEALAAAYKDLLAASADPAGLRAAQRDWLKARDACRSDACLKSAYAERLAALQGGPSRKAGFPAQDFARVKPLLCPKGEACAARDFEFRAEDLDGDGRNEWLVSGPRSGCADQGLACPLTLLRQAGADWTRLCLREPSAADACRGSASGVEALPAKTNGYRDLAAVVVVQRQCCAAEYVYRWDGREYRRAAEPSRHLLYDENYALKPVPKARWERCLKDGRDCLN